MNQKPEPESVRPHPAGAARMMAMASALALATAAGAQTPDNALVMAWNIDNMVTLDPAALYELVGLEILGNLCDTLVTYDVADESAVAPALAESWSVSDDRLSITFTLRAGLSFPSGNPVTAGDAAWSLHRAARMGRAGAASLLEYGFTPDTIEDRIRALDDRTLVFQMDRPYPADVILQAIAAAPIATVLDRATVEQHAAGDDQGNAWLTTNTACIGPYSLARWNPGEVVLMEANAGYWGGAPALDRIVIRHIPEPSAQRLLLEQGDIDLARDLSADSIADLRGAPGITVRTQGQPQLFMVYMNTLRAPFDNPETRLALRYLIDYQGLAEGVMANLGVPRASFLPLGAMGALDAQEGQPFSLDLEAARAHLAAAGYPDGFQAGLLIGSHSFAAPLAQNLQYNASQVGVTLAIEAVATPQVGGRVRVRDYDLVLLPYRTIISDPHGSASVYLANPDNRDEARLGALPSWRTGFHSDEINRRVDAALFEPDPETRAELYRQLQRGMMQTGPYAIMFQLNSIMAHRDRVAELPGHGFRMYYALIRKG